MIKNKSCRDKQIKEPSGFALIATISIMGLLLMVAVGMMNFSSVETRSSGADSALKAARANARMALMIAVGELQQSMGPDQRVSALANIDVINAGQPTGQPTVQPIVQPNLLGVWRSFTQANGVIANIDYTAQKQADFVQWLSSTNIANQTNMAYPTQALVNPIKMVNQGTVQNVADHVDASTINVLDSSGAVTGKYAWHVFDESQKVNLTINKATPTTDAERIASLST